MQKRKQDIHHEATEPAEKVTRVHQAFLLGVLCGVGHDDTDFIGRGGIPMFWFVT